MKHELNQCCGTTCDKQLNAEYVAKLELERDELAAQVNQLKGAIDTLRELKEPTHTHAGAPFKESLSTWQRVGEVYVATPSASLSEVKAQAIEYAAANCETEALLLPAPSGLCRKVDLLELAYRIRKEGK